MLVLLFSDPMVDVLSEIGNVVHVPAFYVSFLLAPLASNACELIGTCYWRWTSRPNASLSLILPQPQ